MFGEAGRVRSRWSFSGRKRNKEGAKRWFRDFPASALREWRLLPLYGFILLPALVLRFKYLPAPAESAAWLPPAFLGDVMSWWKSALLVGVGLWLCLISGARFLLGWRLRLGGFDLAVILSGLAVAASAWMSDWPDTAWLGHPGLYEGGWALLAYLAGLWYASAAPETGADRLKLIRLIGAVALIEAGIGIGQGLGWNFWESAAGKLAIGAPGEGLLYSFSQERQAHGSLFQPNHYGQFMGMAVPLALGMLFAEKSRAWLAFWLAAFASGALAVFYSHSRAALAACLLVTAGWTALAAFRRAGKEGWRKLAGRPGLRIRIAAAGAVALAAALAAGTDPDGAGRVFRKQIERTSGELILTRPASVLREAELFDNRLTLRRDDGDAVLAPMEDGGWEAWREGGGVSRAEVRRMADGRERLTFPNLPGCVLLRSPDGNVEFRQDDVVLDLFVARNRLFVIDGEDAAWPEMRPPARIGVGGLERLGSGRLYIWSRALPLVGERPWLGSGPGTFALVFPNLDLLGKQRFFFRETVDKPHAAWLGLLVQLGCPGFLAFVAWFALAARAGLREGGALSRAILLGMAGYVLGSLTNDSTVGATPIFCVLCGLAAGGARPGPAGCGYAAKRLLDLSLVLLSAPLTLPLLALLAVLVRLDSPGPILFRQWRLGKGLTEFEIYKFRTMRPDAPSEVPTRRLRRSRRHITRLGRFLRRLSLDELPQLYNVIRGELSLVGPRPVLRVERELVRERSRRGANDIAPGITGLAQINGRDILDPETKAGYDGEYAANASLGLDLKILLLTLPAVARRSGVAEGGDPAGRAEGAAGGEEQRS